MKHTLILIAATATTILSSVSAHASCADPRSPAVFRQMPAISLPAAASTSRMHSGDAAKNIVGTWLATYTVQGNAFGQAYIQWHSDGTEWENINLPISGGNICMGSWVKVDAKHVARNHYGWLYTDGTVSGYFNETETDTVAKNGTYVGTNEQIGYDLSGNQLFDVTGTSSAVFVTP